MVVPSMSVNPLSWKSFMTTDLIDFDLSKLDSEPTSRRPIWSYGTLYLSSSDLTTTLVQLIEF